jgi:RES domain-containing protein
MIVYRIALKEFCDLSGEGAKRYGGRWNLPGHPAIYASSSVSSALLERLTIDPELFAAERYVLYSVMEIVFPDKSIFKPTLNELPKAWDAIPPSRASQTFGSDLLMQGILVFAVPSVVDTSSFNYVINPIAKGFGQLIYKTRPLKLDQRIIR